MFFLNLFLTLLVPFMCVGTKREFSSCYLAKSYVLKQNSELLNRIVWV